MRAMSMTPQAATAIVEGLNSVESVNWSAGAAMPPSLQELIAIHAAVRYPDAASIAKADKQNIPPPHLAGYIVAVAKAGHWQRARYEAQYLFRLENVRKLPHPISAMGSLGLWTVERDIERQIWDALGEKMPTVEGAG